MIVALLVGAAMFGWLVYQQMQISDLTRTNERLASALEEVHSLLGAVNRRVNWWTSQPERMNSKGEPLKEPRYAPAKVAMRLREITESAKTEPEPPPRPDPLQEDLL